MICWVSKKDYIRAIAAVKKLRAERNHYKKLAEELEQSLKDAIFENAKKAEDDLK